MVNLVEFAASRGALIHTFLDPVASSLPTRGLTLTATATEQASEPSRTGKKPAGSIAVAAAPPSLA